MSAEKKQRVVRPNFCPILPSNIIDVWRLYADSQKEHKRTHPDLSEVSEDSLRGFIYKNLASEGFVGVMARSGKRPIGYLMGGISGRSVGNPKVFVSLSLWFVDPKFRGQGLEKALISELFSALKKLDVHYFECVSELDLKDEFTTLLQGSGKLVSQTYAGKIEV